MKKQLAVLAAVALVGTFAKADDKGTEFKFGGEVMQRFQSTQSTNLQGGGSSSATNGFLSKNQFHVNAISSDKLQAYFDFIHAAAWGSANTIPTNPYPYSTNAAGAGPNLAGAPGVANTLQVSEAWLWWKVSDMFSIRSGRQGIDYGDGLVFSRNDWLAVPYTADSMMGRLSWDFLDLDFGGGVLSDLGPNSTLVVGSGNTDTQTVFYGAYASVKTLPEWLKKGEIFVLQTNFDAGLPLASQFVPSYTAGGGALGLTSVGIHLKGDANIIDYRLDGVYQTGTQKAFGAQTQSISFASNMIDAEVGANFPEFMKARVFVNYHRDTGNDSSDPTQQHQYQPLFYDRHTYGGLMDTVGFGNLTDIRVGLDVSPMEDTKFGLRVNMMSRTTTGNNGAAGTQWLTAAEGNMFGTLNAANVNGTSSDLGTEFALTADHNYGHGFSMNGQLGFWTLGNYFKPTGANTGSPMQLVANAKYMF